MATIMRESGRSFVSSAELEIVKDITNGKMADLVVEMVGHQTETINDCLDLVKRGGTILAFGVPDDNNYNFRYGDFFRQNICSFQNTNFF